MIIINNDKNDWDSVFEGIEFWGDNNIYYPVKDEKVMIFKMKMLPIAATKNKTILYSVGYNELEYELLLRFLNLGGNITGIKRLLLSWNILVISIKKKSMLWWLLRLDA